MKFKNVFLAMAFVCAIGLSFATERTNADPVQDYVDIGGGTPMAVEEVTNCGIPEEEDDFCVGRFAGNSTPYPIYDDFELENLKEGSGAENITLIPID